MADERRYGDEEVQEIFDLAISEKAGERPLLSDERGLTLGELQDVALEVGVEPARIAAAVRAFDARREALPRRASLGMPVSVGRVVKLPQSVVDPWDSVVEELRDWCGARGQLASHGAIREWTDGNLRASLEPTGSGHQLRLTVRKGGAIALNRIGGATLVAGMGLLTVIVTGGASPVGMELTMLSLLGIGTGALALNKLTLPRWARDREGQLEYLAGRVIEAVQHKSEESES